MFPKMASFTKWDISLSGILRPGPMGVPLGEVLLYIIPHQTGHVMTFTL